MATVYGLELTPEEVEEAMKSGEDIMTFLRRKVNERGLKGTINLLQLGWTDLIEKPKKGGE